MHASDRNRYYVDQLPNGTLFVRERASGLAATFTPAGLPLGGSLCLTPDQVRTIARDDR